MDDEDLRQALMKRGLYSLDGHAVAGKVVASGGKKGSSVSVENATERLAEKYSTLDGGTVSAGIAAVAKAENEGRNEQRNERRNERTDGRTDDGLAGISGVTWFSS